MAVLTKLANEVVRRVDGWINTYTGLGTALDKAAFTTHSPQTRQSPLYNESLFHDNRIARRCVELPAQEMVRVGFDIETADANYDQAALMDRWRELDLDSMMARATALAKATGGAGLVLGVDDGNDTALPLNEAKIKSLRWVRLVGRQALIPKKHYSVNSDKFGSVELYEVRFPGSSSDGQPSQLVHESRVVLFDGEWVTDTRRAENGGWGDSAFHSLEEGLAAVGSSFQSLGHMLVDSSQAVMKIKDLHQIMAMNSEGDDAIRQKLRLVQMGRSIARAIVLDADGEEFSYHDRSFAGVTDSVYATMYFLSALSGIPVTLLFGMSPGGLQATGEADIEFFYSRIANDQVTYLKPRHSRLLKIVMLALGKGMPAKWDIAYRPLRQMTEKQKAELRKLTSEADAIDITNQVLLPEEVAISRYGGEKYSTTTQIDLRLREDIKTEQASEADKPEDVDDPADQTSNDENGDGDTSPPKA